MTLPYFPLYPSDFEAKTSHLTMLEDGAYNRLLRLCWMTPGCSLPGDEAWIMRRARAHTDEEKQAVRTVLDEFFTTEKGRVQNPRLTREAMLAETAHDKRVSSGRKGGRKPKLLKINDTDESNALAKPKQPEPEPYNTDANASDGAAVDFAKAIFENGVAFLRKHGTPERQARSVVGLWRKDHEDREIFDAFVAAKREGVIDPVPWITARLGAPPGNFVPQFDLSKFEATQ